MIKKCKECGFPSTRPGLIFVDSTCAACLNFKDRANIDWKKRGWALEEICNQYRTNSGYDVLIPVSGGKDSHTLVKTMEDLNMNILLFNVADWFTTTRAGKHNLDNLCKKHELVVRKMSRDVFVNATRAAFEQTGEALRLIEYLIYLWPIQYAQQTNIPLVLFGEDSAFQYGTSLTENQTANEQIEKMIEKLRAEEPFWETVGISKREIERAMPQTPISTPKILWMSYFRPWNSADNLKIAKSMGLWTLSDTGEWDRHGVFPDDDYEQIDSVAYLTHLYLKVPKFGFGRCMDIATRRWRLGLISAEERDAAIAKHDGVLDPWAKRDFIDTLRYSETEFWRIVKKHWNEKNAGIFKIPA